VRLLNALLLHLLARLGQWLGRGEAALVRLHAQDQRLERRLRQYLLQTLQLAMLHLAQHVHVQLVALEGLLVVAQAVLLEELMQR
jgi:hypothetical protein